jgi:uncharacterized integral membrane protein
MMKSKSLFWAIGAISAAAMTLVFALRNSSSTHVDLIFIEGDFALSFLMLASFLLGFLLCWVFLGVRKFVKGYRTMRQFRPSPGAESPAPEEAPGIAGRVYE